MRKPQLVFGSLALAGSMIAATAVSASATSKVTASHAASGKATTVKPDFAFYRGKTITLVTSASAGGANDVQNRILTPYIAAYLHAQVVLENHNGGASIPGQNIAASEPPNGLYMGQVKVTGDIGDYVTNTPGLQFNLRALPFLVSPAPTVAVLVATPASGIKTFQQMVNSTTPISTLVSANADDALYSQLLFGAYHIPNKFIYGYAGTPQIQSGFARGDGQTTLQSYSQYVPLILGHLAVPLVQSAAPAKGSSGYSITRHIPTLSQLAQKSPPKTKDGKAELAMALRMLGLGVSYFVPVGTPAKYQAALNAAIIWAATRKGAIAQEIAAGFTPGYVLPETSKKRVNGVIALQPQLKIWLQATGAATTS